MKVFAAALLGIASLTGAQTVSINGTVTDAAGTPIAGVVVALAVSGEKDTTDTEGRYQLGAPDNTALGLMHSGISGLTITATNRGLFFKSGENTPMTAQLFDCRGVRIATLFNGALQKGEGTEVALPAALAHAMHLLRMTTPTGSETIKLTPQRSGIFTLQKQSAPLTQAVAPVAEGTDWLQAAKSGYASHTEQINTLSGTIDITLDDPVAPDFGSQVNIFDPTMNMGTIQSTLNTIFTKQEYEQFGYDRYAYFFKPGSYNLDVNLGFYTHAVGLGRTPDDVIINGAVHSEADWMNGNATCTFWRGIENLSITPSNGATINWAVSQGTFFRRDHVRGNVNLWDNAYSNAWSSGGFLADTKIDGQLASGTQQQWFTRNSALGSWNGSNWNMVFSGVLGGPAASWPSPAYTVIDNTPLISEKPYLAVDDQENWVVRVPLMQTDKSGRSWYDGNSNLTAATEIPLDQFYIAKPEATINNNAKNINAALAAGKNLIFTPGIYWLDSAIKIIRPNTVVLGFGLATLIPWNATPALDIADVDGVRIGGVMVDAGEHLSQVLVKVGESGSGIDHSANPTILQDLFCRIGGFTKGSATTAVEINSNNVIGDNLWLWRADHGNEVGWWNNMSDHGLVVNGDDVTMYGLFSEHFQKEQVLWNGNGGRTIFFQNELPYDAPSQADWQHDGVNGYAAYKVSDNVTTHEAWGMGSYGVFISTPANVKCENAFEAPDVAGVKLHHMTAIWITGASGTETTHVFNGQGAAVNSSRQKSQIE